MFDPATPVTGLKESGNPWEFMDLELNRPFDTNAENKSYKACLTCCGKCKIMSTFLCACCGCGPIQVIEQGTVGLKLRFGKYVSKLKPGLYTFNPSTEEI
jgi:regulator of protease activity HflC (stomatin/prohibitin superfamily)